MRIQHNIMAMNAYRNYSNNISAMKSSLEKLSSGYKINRAGDDAAGLAISEKMRAQITGLQTAQKNAKDGISLVQTAEGALTEVHDMLNRMVELATQSANGTYDNATDRNQLQKELDQLKTEINRIADSANFNGIKLLDGSMALTDAIEGSSVTNSVEFSGMDRILQQVKTSSDVASEVDGSKTILDSSTSTPATAKITVDFKGVAINNVAVSGSGSEPTTVTVKIGDASFDLNLEMSTAGSTGNLKISYNNGTADVDLVTSGFTADTISKPDDASSLGKALATAVDKLVADQIKSVKNEDGTKKQGLTINGVEWKVSGTVSDTTIKLEQVEVPKTTSQARSDFAVQVTLGDAGEETFINPALNTIKEINETNKNGVTLSGQVNTGVVTDVAGVSMADATRANTVFEIKESDIKDGTTISIGNANIVLCVGGNSSKTKELGEFDATALAQAKTDVAGTNTTASLSSDEGGEAVTFYVDLTDMDPENINLDAALAKISETVGPTIRLNAYNPAANDGAGAWQSVQFEFGVERKENGNSTTGLSIQRKFAYNPVSGTDKDLSKDVAFTSLEQLANNFGIKTTETIVTEAKEAGKGLTLQIGDTAEDFNQLKVSINDCHVDAIGIGDVSIADQESAAAAVDKIKAAINYVSDVRGTLGATQNRLDHTINNLSVMTENIQDAESTIRDVDVAEEMMAYTKNNILIQSAQAMLAQANQVPQGVLQLLG